MSCGDECDAVPYHNVISNPDISGQIETAISIHVTVGAKPDFSATADSDAPVNRRSKSGINAQ